MAAAAGPRAARLADVLDRSLAHTLARLGWDNVAACYPTVAARAPGALRAARAQMVDRLGRLCRAEFDAVLRDRHVVARLNELEALVERAEARRAEVGAREDGVVP